MAGLGTPVFLYPVGEREEQDGPGGLFQLFQLWDGQSGACLLTLPTISLFGK